MLSFACSGHRCVLGVREHRTGGVQVQMRVFVSCGCSLQLQAELASFHVPDEMFFWGESRVVLFSVVSSIVYHVTVQ